MVPLALTGAIFACACQADPQFDTFPAGGPGRTAGAAAAALSGVYATTDLSRDSVEIRDTAGTLIRSVSREQITAVCPWMTLTAPSDDGPFTVALSDSGRLAFIAVRDDSAAVDGFASDAILRLDVETGALNIFARLELGDPGVLPLRAGLGHYKGRLHVAFDGTVRTYNAVSNFTGSNTNTPLATSNAGSAGIDMSLAVDRAGPTGSTGLLFVSCGDALLRAPIPNLSSVTFLMAGTIMNTRSIAWSDHYGGASSAGLYATTTRLSSGVIMRFVNMSAARGNASFSPIAYAAASFDVDGIAATTDGRLLVAATTAGAFIIRESTDARLNFDAWARDEFAQVVQFGRGLVTANPTGWVIDTDVTPGNTRFHPASPDAAAWTVLLLTMNHQLNGDPAAQGQVRTILERYGGLAADGIDPVRSVDGIFRHWMEPNTGGVKAGWDPEFATLSTMKMVLAAARAKAHWPQDAAIDAAARAIICPITNWDAYFQPASRALFLRGQQGGGPVGGGSGPFNEGIIFAEQAAAYGGAGGDAAFARWLTRAGTPSAQYVAGQPVTGDVANQFQSAFTSLYPLLTVADYRANPNWQAQVRAVRINHAAWTDDSGPYWNTVFSAGTTKTAFVACGYNADSLTNHPGDITTFTSLMALSAGDGASGGRRQEAAAAYNAFRRGTRQTFSSGASILYRRSNIDPGYLPNSAGLPDVALGALGLAELIQPGSVAAVLAGPYPSCTAPPPPQCPPDFNGDGSLDPDDLADFIGAFFSGSIAADFNGDSSLDPDDLADFIGAFFAGCN